MSLSGRPKEEGGHKRAKFSLNIETLRTLEKLTKDSKNKSKLVEEAIAFLEKEKNPEKRRRFLRVLLKRQYEIADSLRERRRQRFYESFNKPNKEEALALWLFGAVDQLLHCFKIAWNMKDKEANPSSVEYLEEYLDADLEFHLEHLREGFVWIGRNGNEALFQYLRKLYYRTHSLYENFARISRVQTDISEGKGEIYDEYRKLGVKEARKRGIKITDLGKANL